MRQLLHDGDGQWIANTREAMKLQLAEAVLRYSLACVCIRVEAPAKKALRSFLSIAIKLANDVREYVLLYTIESYGRTEPPLCTALLFAPAKQSV